MEEDSDLVGVILQLDVIPEEALVERLPLPVEVSL